MSEAKELALTGESLVILTAEADQMTDMGRAILVAVFEGGNDDDVIEEIRRQALSVVADPETAKGREILRSTGAKVGAFRSMLDKQRKALKAWVEADVKDRVQVIDASGRKIQDGLAALREAVVAPAVAVEQRIAADQKRQQDVIDYLRGLSAPVDGASASDWESRLIAAETMMILPDFGRRRDEARDVQRSVIDWLKERLAAAIKAEADAARLAELERIAAEQAAEIERQRRAEEQRQREEELKRWAAEDARIRAEEAALRQILAAERREREAREAQEAAERKVKQDAEEAERREREHADALARAAQAERERIESEQRAKAEEVGRIAADKAVRARCLAEAKEDLVSAGLSDSDAKKAINAIANGCVLHVSISYSAD